MPPDSTTPRCYAQFLPKQVKTFLFGDRQLHGREPRPNDEDWAHWERQQIEFYLSVQKRGVGKFVNDAGYGILSRFDLTDKIICELGPGSLPHLRFWRGVPKTYHGVDVSQDFLGFAKRVLSERFSAVEFRAHLHQRGDALLPLADESIDLMFTFYSLEHLYPLGGYLDEFLRVLKPGGLVVGAIPTEGGLAWGIGRALTSRRWIRDNMELDFHKILCWEHPNFSDEVIGELGRRFERESLSFYPLSWLPALDLNLVVKFAYRKRV